METDCANVANELTWSRSLKGVLQVRQAAAVPHVGHLGPALPRQQHIVGLQVSVYNAPLMQGLQPQPYVLYHLINSSPTSMSSSPTPYGSSIAFMLTVGKVIEQQVCLAIVVTGYVAQRFLPFAFRAQSLLQGISPKLMLAS